MSVHRYSVVSFCLIALFLLTGCSTALLKHIPGELKSNEENKFEDATDNLTHACSDYVQIAGASIYPCETSSLGITKSSYLTYTEGKPFYHQVQTSGGTPPVTFRPASDPYSKLPESLHLTETGLLWGTGPSGGPYGCIVEATDKSSKTVKTTLFLTKKENTLSIIKPPPLTYTAGKAFSYQLQTSGGKEITFTSVPDPSRRASPSAQRA